MGIIWGFIFFIEILYFYYLLFSIKSISSFSCFLPISDTILSFSMPQKQDKKQPEKDDTLTAIQGMKTVVLGLDFSPDFDAIREMYHPVEINQIRRDASEEVLAEPLEFDTLTALVDAVKKQKKVTILTKQPSVIKKFCKDNSLDVTVYEWKL